MIQFEQRPKGKRVQLMATCLCDAFFDDVAQASVEVLEYLGCEVIFPTAQTCCGQPAFNSGDWPAARKVVRHTCDVFSGNEPIIVPSGSCAAMLFHGAGMAFEKEADHDKITALGQRSWEITDFIVNGLNIKSWPGKYSARIALHQACHTRGTPSREAVTTLLNSVDGLELIPTTEDEQCCGFGGTFSVAFPHISAAMGNLKIENLMQPKPDLVVSSDMSCLMHQQGLAEKQNIPYKAMHIVQLLRDSLNRK